MNSEHKQNGLFSRNGTSYMVPFVLVTTLFFLWGFARAILDILNKHFQNELNISITQSSLIQVTTYLGYFLMAIPAGLFINRFGYRRGVVFGLCLFGAGALLFIPGAYMGTFYAFLLCLFIIGCGLTFLETAANPYVTELGAPETATSRLNLSQSFNGLGSLFATFVIGQFFFSTESSGDVVVPYSILGALVLLIAVIFAHVPLPEISQAAQEAEEDGGGSGLANIRELFARHPMFVFGLLALLAYEVAEISINSYFINFVTGEGWMGDNTASIVLTGALAFFMVGRFVGSYIMRRVSGQAMLLVCAVGTVASISLVLLNLGRLSLFALLANYFFEAIMFPTIFSLALIGVGRLTKSASSLLMMTPVGGCGFLLMGFIADRTNLIVPFFIPLAGYLVILVYALMLWRRRLTIAKGRTVLLTATLLLMPLAGLAQDGKRWALQAGFGGVNMLENRYDDGERYVNEDQGNSFYMTADYYLTQRLALTGGLVYEQQGLFSDYSDGIGLKKVNMLGIEAGAKYYFFPKSWVFQPHIGGALYTNMLNLGHHRGEAPVVLEQGYPGIHGVLTYDVSCPAISLSPQIGVDIHLLSSLSLCIDYDYRFGLWGHNQGWLRYTDGPLTGLTDGIDERNQRGCISVGLKVDFPLKLDSGKAGNNLLWLLYNWISSRAD